MTNPLDDLYPGKKYVSVVRKIRETAYAEPQKWANQVQNRPKAMLQTYLSSLTTQLRPRNPT